MGAQAKDKHSPGFDAEAYGDESPPHEVEVAGFHIARYPLTVLEFARFVAADGYRDEDLWSEGGFGQCGEAPADWDSQLEHPTRPVVEVSWFEACAYCRWLTQQRREAGVERHGEVVRLPSEAQWEWAARGTAGRRYAWGAEAPGEERCNFDQNVGAPTPVGVYPLGATPQGVQDLCGNVWEWCLDTWESDYQRRVGAGESRTPVESEEEGKSLRGGSWIYESRYVRAAFRYNLHPDLRDFVVGFRVLLSTRQD